MAYGFQISPQARTHAAYLASLSFALSDMKAAKIAEIVSLVTVLISLVLLYGVGIYVAIQYGEWPRYGYPETWEPRPSEAIWNIIGSSWGASLYMLPVGIIGMISKTIIANLRGIKIPYIYISLAIIALYIFSFADPFGLMEWYAD
jgi:hypothetical protein